MRLNREKTKLTNKRWAAYAAAGAAGAVAALGPQIAEADIQVTEVGQRLEDANIGDGAFDVFGPYTFGAAGASFVFNQAFSETGVDLGILTMSAFGNMSIAGSQAGGSFYVANLAAGANVSSANFGIGAGDRGDLAWAGSTGASQFLDAGVGYVGVRFDLGAGTQYGWIELDLEGNPSNRGTLVAFGWEDTVGATIAAGDRGGIVPEPASLGVLALGSMGLLAWRRKRSA